MSLPVSHSSLKKSCSQLIIFKHELFVTTENTKNMIWLHKLL